MLNGGRVKRGIQRVVLALTNRRICRRLGDVPYLKIKFWAFLGRRLDLKHPRSFNEKMQWLKINYYDERLPRMVDKYAVREYIREWIGEEYLVPLLGVWDRAEEIDWDSLPDRFVLKCTHGSHTNIICTDKAKLDRAAAAETLDRWLDDEWTYYFGREWPYLQVKPRIIAEAFIESDEPGGIRDYKFLCFHGKPDNMMICSNRQIGQVSFDHFTRDWKLIRCQCVDQAKPADYTVPPPPRAEEMFAVAEKLAAHFPFVRVDLYCEHDRIYFGELTFFPASGFDTDYSREGDMRFGSLIRLEAFARDRGAIQKIKQGRTV